MLQRTVLSGNVYKQKKANSLASIASDIWQERIAWKSADKCFMCFELDQEAFSLIVALLIESA